MLKGDVKDGGKLGASRKPKDSLTGSLKLGSSPTIDDKGGLSKG